MKKILLEGRYDSIVSGLSNRILRVFKDSYSAVLDPHGKFAGQQIYFISKDNAPEIKSDRFEHVWFEEVENENIPLEFYIELRIQWIGGLNLKRYTVQEVNADAFNEDKFHGDEVPLICVYITADPKDYPNVLSQVAMLLRDSIRHEIEHLTQSGYNTIPSKYLKSDQAKRNNIDTGKLPPREYYLLPKEIPAMIQGMYSYAKKTRTPLKQVIAQNLDRPDLSDADREKILSVWRPAIKRLGIKQEI